MNSVYIKTINKLIYTMALLGWENISYHYVFIEPSSAANGARKFKDECSVIKKLADAFNIKIFIYGPFYYDTSPKNKKYKYPAALKNFSITYGSYVTSNLIKPLDLDTKQNRCTILYEGLSTLRYINQDQTLRYWINKLFMKNRHLYCYKEIILPDSPSNIIKPYKTKKCINVIEHFFIKRNFEVIGKLLGLNKFFDKLKHVTSVLLPPSELSVDEKIQYIEYIVDKNKDEIFLLKVHPKELFFLDKLDHKNVLIVPEELNHLPFELFLSNIPRSLKYFGYYSSVMLFFETEKINLYKPKKESICKLYEREYWSYIRLMKSSILTLNLEASDS